MTTPTLRGALALSLLLNLGVLGTMAWQKLATDGLPMPSGAPTALSRELQLSAEQLGRWHDLRAPYLARLQAAETALAEQHQRLLDALLGERADAQRIAGEQARLAELREARQQLLVEQLLAERELLDARQRDRLVGYLAAQDAVGAVAVGR